MEVNCRLLGVFGYLGSSFALGALLAAPVGAQQSTSPSSINAGSELEEITVTAQRRTERLEDVPATVSVIGANELAQNNIVRLDQLSQLAPGTNIAHSGIFIQPTIRGISTQVIGPGQENNVAVYVDGFYEPDSTVIGSDFVNVSSIEILEGPQGSLYGRSATGGAILINTRGPSKDFVADIDGGYANYNDRKMTGFVSGPITDRLSFSLSGYWHAGNGYIRSTPQSVAGISCGAPVAALGGIPCSINSYADVDFGNAAPLNGWDARIKLKYEITDNLDVTFGYHYFYYSDATALAYDTYYISPNLVPPGSPLAATAPNQSNEYPPALLGRPAGSIPSNQPGNEYSLLTHWDTGYGTLTGRTFYTSSEATSGMAQDGTLIGISSDQSIFTRETTEQMIDYATTINRLSLLAGVFYYRDLGKNVAGFESNTYYVTTPTTWVDTSVFTGAGGGEMNTSSYSGYIDATYALTDALFFTAGGRYNYDHKTFESSDGGNIYVPAYNLNEPYGPNVVPTQTATFRNTTPRANLRYELTKDTNVYVAFSQGFKAGTFNTINYYDVEALKRPVAPELATNYEVGFKTRGDWYAVSADTYYTRYSDQQVSTEFTVPVLGLQTGLTNANSRIYGIELKSDIKPTSNLVISANLAWTHARYTSYPDAITPLGSVENKDGQQLPRAADYTGNLNIVYTIPNVFDGSVDLGANIYATSGYFTNVGEIGTAAANLGPSTIGQNLFYQDGYELLNLSAKWSANEHYWAQLWVNNVASKMYTIWNSGEQYAPSGVGPTSPLAIHIFAPPRTFGIKLGYKF
jgi:iron complex outermembrane recepter protein